MSRPTPPGRATGLQSRGSRSRTVGTKAAARGLPHPDCQVAITAAGTEVHGAASRTRPACSPGSARDGQLGVEQAHGAAAVATPCSFATCVTGAALSTPSPGGGHVVVADRDRSRAEGAWASLRRKWRAAWEPRHHRTHGRQSQPRGLASVQLPGAPPGSPTSTKCHQETAPEARAKNRSFGHPSTRTGSSKRSADRGTTIVRFGGLRRCGEDADERCR